MFGSTLGSRDTDKRVPAPFADAKIEEGARSCGSLTSYDMENGTSVGKEQDDNVELVPVNLKQESHRHWSLS